MKEREKECKKELREKVDKRRDGRTKKVAKEKRIKRKMINEREKREEISGRMR